MQLSWSSSLLSFDAELFDWEDEDGISSIIHFSVGRRKGRH